MADIAALQLPTMSPPSLPASFPTSPDSPQRAQLLWRCSASSEGDLSEQKGSVSARLAHKGY